MPKSIIAYTERNEEPVHIYLEDTCPDCCETFYSGDNSSTIHVKKKYADWNPKKESCSRCGDTRAIIGKNGIVLLDFVAKYLK